MEIPGRMGALCEIPSVVGLWIFSGSKHYHNFLQTNITLSFFQNLKHVEHGPIHTCLILEVGKL